MTARPEQLGPSTLDESMDNTVAEIQGVGVTYRIRQVHQAPLYDVEAMSGPVQRVVLHAFLLGAGHGLRARRGCRAARGLLSAAQGSARGRAGSDGAAQHQQPREETRS